MPISKKILDEINKLEDSNEFKKLLLELLEKEDQGNHRNNQVFEEKIIDYINRNESGEEK